MSQVPYEKLPISLQLVGSFFQAHPQNLALIVRHGNVVDLPRPDYSAIVLWIGSIEPSNRQPQDIYFYVEQ